MPYPLEPAPLPLAPGVCVVPADVAAIEPRPLTQEHRAIVDRAGRDGLLDALRARAAELVERRLRGTR